MAERIVGIDFGTSTTAIRVRRYEDGTALDAVPSAVLFDSHPTVPSLIQRMKNGKGCYYGYSAEAPRRGADLYQNFKLNLENPDKSVRTEARELTAEYLKYLGEVYSHQSQTGFLGDSSDTVKTYISYPVKWSEETRAFMREAATAAGFPNVCGMDEAQACIQAVTEQYAAMLTSRGYFRENEPCTILLIDMGAGTTDLVLCRHTPGAQAKTEVLSTWPKGDEALFGGHEVDDLLAEYIKGSFPEIASIVSHIPISAFKAWKDMLVSPTLAQEETVDYFDRLDQISNLLGIDLAFDPIDRAKFETLAAEYLPTLPKLIRGVLADADMSGDRIDLVILTGGHSQWYFVKEMLLGRMPQFGEIKLKKIQAEPARIVTLERPQETVALGLVVYHVSAEEMYNCGENYYYGRGVKQDYAEAVKCYRKAAEQGYAVAQNNLGDCYYNGQGVKQDYAEAVSWFRKAAEQGYAVAQYKLGECYYYYHYGRGMQQDYAEAVRWFWKAAEQGHAGAQCHLGMCYYYGHGVKQDYAEAVKWYRKAEEQGHAGAQYYLGECYFNGHGVKQDYAEAVMWYRKAAEQGHAWAQNNLGLYYYNVKQDYAEAVSWFRKAAEQGHAGAQGCLDAFTSTGKA